MSISASSRAAGVAVDTTFRDLRVAGTFDLPQRVAIVGQGSTASTYATTKLIVTSAQVVGETYGFGSPVHLAALQVLPSNGDGVGTIPVTIYPLEDDGSSVVADGDITPSGTVTAGGTFTCLIGGVVTEPFSVAIGDVVADIVTAMTAAINATLNVPVIAVDGTTLVTLTSKWEGISANAIVTAVNGPTTIGVSFGITQLANGAVDPDVDLATALFGDVWETLVVNCLDILATGSLTKYATFGEGRWGGLVRKPLIVFTGNTIAAVGAATTEADSRMDDRVNCQLVAPGSDDLPLSIAARQVARIAGIADENPPQDYTGQNATGVNPGDDSEQWDYNERDQAIKAGSSTIVVKDGVINMSDTVTFFHPVGDENPAYRYVVDIIKLMQVIHNLDLIFDGPGWAGAPLLPDEDPTNNPTARKPRSAVAAVNTMIDQLGLSAIISDPETAKENTTAVIDSGNPKRLNVSLTIQLSGNVAIIAVNLDFGFFFGS